MPVSEVNSVTKEGAELGRFLFYDPLLSSDSSISCASCHIQKYAFSGGPVSFSKGIAEFETVRNTLPLFNLAWNKSMFWDGRVKTIEDQVSIPIIDHKEMHGDWNVILERLNKSERYDSLFMSAFGSTEKDSLMVIKAIAQFERTLISANSRFDSVLRREAVFTKEEFEGFEIVNDQTRGNCLHCHTTDANALGTTGLLSNNGFQKANRKEDYSDIGAGARNGDSSLYGWFKIPSLRNLAFTAPYMHNGSLTSIDEVLKFYQSGIQYAYNIDSKLLLGSHHSGVNITDDELLKIEAFLNTLNDFDFIQNPKFSNPFPTKKGN